MPVAVRRRRVLATALIAAALPAARAQAAGAARRLTAGTRIIEVDGKPARVFGLAGPDGRPGITLDRGERFQVTLVNALAERTIVHWHGQLPPWTQDGFPWPQTPPLEPGASRTYDYPPVAGTYWMHSHEGLQEQRLLTAPLIVRGDEAREDRQDVVMLLNDFSFRAPDEILAGLTGRSAAAEFAATRRTENAPAPPMRDAAAMQPASGGAMGAGGTMDLNDVDYDAFLANDRSLADPDVVRVEPAGRIRLRVINGAASSNFWIDLGGLRGRVVAADGRAVRPVEGGRFPLAVAQRLDILIDLPGGGAFAVFATLEGTRRRTGIVLASVAAPVSRFAGVGERAPAVDMSLERRLAAMTPLASQRADRHVAIRLDGGMKPYAWSLNAAYWPAIAPLMVARGQRVEIEFVNASMMAHPMHLHGHAFQVIGLDGIHLSGAVRDTVLVMPGRRVRIAFDADNPGRWPLHCHNLYHLATGMMTELRYEGVAV